MAKTEIPNIEELLSYGSGISVIELNRENTESYFRYGLISTDYQGRRARNTSYDCVCFTIVPDGRTALDRLATITKKNWNWYLRDMLEKELPRRVEAGTTLAAVIADFEKVSECKNVSLVKANGHLPSPYFTKYVDGIEPISFKECLRVNENLFRAEVRIYLEEPRVKPPHPDLTGVTQEAWKALLVRPTDTARVVKWINSLEPTIIQRSIPIYDVRMNYVGNTNPSKI